jgi:hypothetical protein
MLKEASPSTDIGKGESPMDSIDFTGLAAKAVAGLREVRACLLASRDGLTLAALPEGGEELARRALDRLETVGQPERGFLVISDEVWVVARRGPYVGIVVAAATSRAGLILDRLESTLRAAEEARLLAGSAGPPRPDTPRRPRTPLHREPRAEPRPEMKTPDSLFEEVARVVSVPEKEAQRAEPSLSQPPPSSAWPHLIREPQAPNGGDPGSPHEPPTIVRPEPTPEPQEPNVVAPEPEEEKVAAPEPEPVPDVSAPEPESEQPMVMAPEPESEPEPEVEKVVPPEPAPEEEKLVAAEPEPEPEKEQELPVVPALEPQPSALNVDSPRPESEKPRVEPEPEPLKLMSARPEPESAPAEPAKAEATPHAPTPEIIPVTPPRLAHPEVEPPKETPHYSPSEALLGEMGRVVAGETSPGDILPPGVSPSEALVAPTDSTGEDTAEPSEAKKPEASKERSEDTEVDPVALAREFSQLFDEPERNS